MTCAVSECDKPFLARGWCSMHYSRWRAHGDVELPTKAARICSVVSCERSPVARGWCGAHWNRWKRYGDVGPAEVKVYHKGDPCSVDGCDRPYTRRGLCEAHYRRWAKSGNPGLADVQPRHPGAVCTVEGCDRPFEARGWCTTHYVRWQKYGDPGPAAINPFSGPRVEVPTYTGAHCRVYRAKARASDHMCRECENPAVDWAYTNDDPNELIDDRGLRYSVSPDHYVPMCRPCHRAFDAGARSQT